MVAGYSRWVSQHSIQIGLTDTNMMLAITIATFGLAWTVVAYGILFYNDLCELAYPLLSCNPLMGVFLYSRCRWDH